MIQITLTNTGVHAALASLLQRIDHPQVGYFNPHPARRPGESTGCQLADIQRFFNGPART